MELLTALAKEICTIIRNKTRKEIFNKHYTKKSTNEKYYYYNEFEHGAEMDDIEKLLFIPSISPANALSDDEIAEFDFLDNSSQNGNADQWGEPDPLIDFSVEEILDMPTLSEVPNSAHAI